MENTNKVDLIEGLKNEIKNYEAIQKDNSFVPFEDWRHKLEDYLTCFNEEYNSNLETLKRKIGTSQIKKIDNLDKKLILFMGIPGSGKTTLARIIQESLPDTILLEGHKLVKYLNLFDKKNASVYQKRLQLRGFNDPDPWYLSYLYAEGIIKDCLNSGYNVIFDDHIRTETNRLGYYNLAKKSGAKTIFIQLSTPFSICLEREEGKINESKTKFLANFVLQSEDITPREREKYNKIIMVDGSSNISEIKKELLPKLVP